MTTATSPLVPGEEMRLPCARCDEDIPVERSHHGTGWEGWCVDCEIPNFYTDAEVAAASHHSRREK